VYAKLHDLIVSGRIPPGARITEAGVSARLGVSRTPVREAVQRLQYEGYVTVPDHARRGQPVTAPLTLDDARDLMRIIGALEGVAAYNAAQLDDRPRRQLAARLTTINQSLRAAATGQPPNISLLYGLDREFHRAYVEAAGGCRLVQLHRSIKPHVERYGRFYVTTLTGRIQTTLREHAAVIRAIAAGQPARAERAVETNWRNAARSLQQIITSDGERGRW
jgi:DNA-binding GntR family transcriptional regulator